MIAPGGQTVVAEIAPYSEVIASPDFVIKQVDEKQAMNRLENRAIAEGWAAWELEQAREELRCQGGYSETRPNARRREYRLGIVLAPGDGSDLEFGDCVMFAPLCSTLWRGFFSEVLDICFAGMLTVTNGAGRNIELSSDTPIQVLGSDAALFALPYSFSDYEQKKAA